MSRQLLASIAFLVFLLVSQVPVSYAASNDAYIDALNAELDAPSAAGGTVTSNTTEEKENLLGKGKQTLSSELPSGLKPEAFETELKRSFVGSYVFYNKLSNTDKDAVYNYYKQTTSIDDIRNKIKALLTK